MVSDFKMLFVFTILLALAVESHLTPTQLIQLPPFKLTESQTLISSLQIVNFSDSLQHDELRTIKRFQLIAGKAHNSLDVTQMFYVKDLTLRTNKTFDREMLINNGQCNNKCLIKLKVAAYDAWQSLVKIFIQPIEIEDINDNSPQFRKDSYDLIISENLIQSVPIEPPVDRDSPAHSVQACKINEHTNLFNAFFNKITSRLFLKVISPLDRETTSSYQLTINCTDGVSFTSASLLVNVLDANDNVPVFQRSSFNISVPENYGVNSNNKGYSNLIRVEALDNDAGLNGQLAYSLPAELNFDYGNLFRMNTTSGWIQVHQWKLDYEKKSAYTLKVKVNDLGSNPVAIYTDVNIKIIDLNDNAPKADITVDSTYLLQHNKANNTIYIKEELPLQTTIGYLSLSDLDSQVTNGYELNAKLTSVSFVNKTTRQREGNLNMFKLIPIVQDYENIYYGLQTNGRLDREEIDLIDLNFQLGDNARTKLTSQLSLRVILVDINDNPPVASTRNLNLRIKENRQDLHLTKLIITDADLNDTISYKILEDSERFLFGIDSNGWFQVKTGIDREAKSQFEMTIRCSDGSSFTDVAVNVHIEDENDNLPYFKRDLVNFTLTENAVGVIGNLEFVDKDLNPSTVFIIEPAEFADYFRVNNLTGELVAVEAFDTELLQETFIQLEITAVDADLLIDVNNLNKVVVNVQLVDANDNPPVVIGLSEFVVYSDFNNVSLCRFNSSDDDRDAFATAGVVHVQRVGVEFVQRYSWEVVLEVVRNMAANRSDIVELVEGIVRLKNEVNVKYVPQVDVEKLFKVC